MIDKKEIRRKYKESLPPMGIYVFKNIKDEKFYIGSSTNLPGKKNAIEFQLKMKSHMNRKLQEDYNNSGAENFVFEIVDQLEPKEGVDYDYSNDLSALLELWADKLSVDQSNCYNSIKISPDGTKIIGI